MQSWFAEEWVLVAVSIEKTAHPDVQYQLTQRRDDLLRLCCHWQHSVEGMDVSEDIPEWGPTATELRLTEMDMTSELLDEEKWESDQPAPYYPMLPRDNDDDAGEEDIDYDETDFNTVEAFDVMEPNKELYDY
ncbi:hypothetical protein V5O48_010030 [Marasmius crinis-equi]|uniref:Uncharacterized protein n=1 Tax=Marasmius crinis-equi TaxID=585013 RepID=A0ABR3F9Y6_9AGAR